MKTNRSLRFALCAGLLLSPLAALSAQDMGMGMGDDGFYVSVNYGATFPAQLDFDGAKIDTDFGFLGGRLGVGYAIFGFRPELSGGYRLANIKGNMTNHNVTSIDVIGSVYYDVATGTPLTPYVGVGGGMSMITIRRGVNPAPSAWAFAFQGAAGVGYSITDSLIATLGYRLTGTTQTTFKDHGDLMLALGHTGELGLRFRF